MMTPPRVVRMLVVLSGLFLLTGCSTFQRDWWHYERYPSFSGELDGIWEGTWKSDVTGHKGKLRAIITRQSDGCYYAQFHATFAAVLPYEFGVLMTAQESGGVYSFNGSADLGRLAGGVYTYSGHADQLWFVANYCAEQDHGIFRMRRIGACNLACNQQACLDE